MELLITSDVTTNFMTLKNEIFMSYVDFNILFLFDRSEVEKRIHFKDLYDINLLLDKKISLLLPNLEENIDGGVTYVTIVYKKQTFKINYRKENHYVFGTLINLSSIIDVTIAARGVLYVFNKSVLSSFRNASIISLLKTRNRLAPVEIEEAINNLSNEFGSVERINSIDIENSIRHLKSLGFIDNDIYESDKYKLTAKGYMLVL